MPGSGRTALRNMASSAGGALAREVKDNGIGVSGALPHGRRDQAGVQLERIRGADYGLDSAPDITGDMGPLPAQDQTVGVDDVARLTADAILANRLYVLPHEAARTSIRRRFERLDQTFDDQIAEGWKH